MVHICGTALTFAQGRNALTTIYKFMDIDNDLIEQLSIIFRRPIIYLSILLLVTKSDSDITRYQEKF